MKKLLIIVTLLPLALQAQLPDHVYKQNIRTVTLTQANDIFSYPVLSLNSGEMLELHFDDLDGGIKNYYYTYLLCNADWTPSTLFSFDYIKGFQNVRMSTYRNSSIALTRYTHYQAMIPDRNCIPSRSGNYLLKVFLDGDTSKLAFTRRFLVVDTKSAVAAQIQEPLNSINYRSFQKVRTIVTLNSTLNVFNQQEVKTVIVQNFAWPHALYIDRPTIYRGNYFEYNDESSTTFQSGKEWRWLDLRSLRFATDRVQKLDKKAQSTDVYVKPDGDRQKQPYMYYRDNDGLFGISTVDNNNPYWQSDYAYVHFTYVPPDSRPFEGKDLHLYGALTNYTPDGNSRMLFNEEKGVYEKTLFLKQGYYDYSYITVPQKREDDQPYFTLENTEGNYWGTQNTYMILVYYRAFGSRADELIGYTTVSSYFQRAGY